MQFWKVHPGAIEAICPGCGATVLLDRGWAPPKWLDPSTLVHGEDGHAILKPGSLPNYHHLAPVPAERGTDGALEHQCDE